MTPKKTPTGAVSTQHVSIVSKRRILCSHSKLCYCLLPGPKLTRRRNTTWTLWRCCTVWTSWWRRTASLSLMGATLSEVLPTSWDHEDPCVGLTQVKTPLLTGLFVLTRENLRAQWIWGPTGLTRNEKSTSCTPFGFTAFHCPKNLPFVMSHKCHSCSCNNTQLVFVLFATTKHQF